MGGPYVAGGGQVGSGPRPPRGMSINGPSYNVPVTDLPYAKDLVTCLPYAESELRTAIYEAIGAGSACWDNLAGAGVFDSTRARQVADLLIANVLRLTGLGEAHLGCATNRELLGDLMARFEMGNSSMDYRTVD